jgi:hypothetical protein
MQLHGYSPRTGSGTPLPILPDPPTWGDYLYNNYQKQDYRCSFFGVGLSHLGVELLIATTNKLLMHYGCNMATGKLMQTSYSLIFVELGLSFQQLQECYNCYSFPATHSWMKTLWEKLSMLDMKVIVADFNQKYPH